MGYTRAGIQIVLDHANQASEDLVSAVNNIKNLVEQKDEVTNLLRQLIASDPFVDYDWRDYKLMVYKQGTPAIHQLGNIQRDCEGYTEYFSVRGENTNFYHGMFAEGFGFINVYVPKSGMRELTQEETEYINKTRFVIV